MKKGKQIMAGLLAVSLLTSVSACSTTESAQSSTSEATSAEASATSASTESQTQQSDEQTATTESSASVESDTAETGAFGDSDKPTIKILAGYQSYNYNEQPSLELVEELTGYQVEYYMLPSEQAQQKLLLEISSGADYDLLWRLSSLDYAAVASQNALQSLDDLLDQYGDNIKAAVSEMGWESVKDEDGNITGIPVESGTASVEDPYGTFLGGLGIRSDMLEELGMDIPQTLDDFTALLKAAKEKYGFSPLTASETMFFNPILYAFNMGSEGWYDIDGTYTPRVKHPDFVNYLAYIEELYQDQLIDNDTPINSSDNAREKFASGNALMTPLYFWDIPSMVSALATSNPDTSIRFVPVLAPDADTKAVYYIDKGNDGITCIPKTTQNAKYAIDYLNILSSTENFIRVYIGEEGVSYQVEDGEYYPIFGTDGDGSFNDYTNSDKFAGFGDVSERFTLWQARARKTTEMADAYEDMNSNYDNVEFQYNIENYGITQGTVQEYISTLTTAISDAFLTAVVEGTDPETAVQEMIDIWNQNGGLEVEKAMQTYYDENKDKT